MNFWVELSLVLIVAIVLALVIRLYVLVHRLNSSFAKLGFIIREDAKKYFDEAAGKILDTNQQFQDFYSQIVHDGTKKALSEVGDTLESTLAKAQQQAGDIILQSREDARRIVQAATVESEKQSQRAFDSSTDTIGWVMEQYIKKEYSVKQHTDVIEQLLEEYINDRRA